MSVPLGLRNEHEPNRRSKYGISLALQPFIAGERKIGNSLTIAKDNVTGDCVLLPRGKT